MNLVLVLDCVTDMVSFEMGCQVLFQVAEVDHPCHCGVDVDDLVVLL